MAARRKKKHPIDRALGAARKRRAAKATKAKQSADLGDQMRAALEQLRREQGLPVTPAARSGGSKKTPDVDPEQVTARALELAKQASWRYRNRKWLTVLPWALLLAASRGMAHSTPVDATSVVLPIAGLVLLTLATALFGGKRRKLAWGPVALIVAAMFSTSPYVPLVGFAIVAALLVLAGIWFYKVGSTPFPEFQGKIKQIKWARLRQIVDALTTPKAGVMAVAIAAALWWLSPVSTKPAAWLLLTGASITAGLRAFRFRIREVIEPTAIILGREQDWVDHVAIHEGAKGSVMLGTEPVTSPRDGSIIGWAAGIEFAKGHRGASEVVNSLRSRVATTYSRGPKDVMWEVNPDNDREARLVVLDSSGNALNENHVWEGSTDFDPETGIFTHGIRADWTPARLRLYKPNYGAFHGHFSGGTGGGKTRGLDLAMRLSTQHDVVVPIVIDLGGSEFVPWEPHVPLFLGKREDGDEELGALAALQLLKNISALVQHRQKKLGMLRREDASIEAYPVDEAHPVIWPIFDEWQFAISMFKTKAPTAELASRFTPGGQEWGTISSSILNQTKLILTQARKSMIPLWLAGQALSLTEGFGNLSSVRNQCAQGNMVGYRNTAEAAQQAFGGSLQVNLATIPSGTKGACFLSSPEDSRDAMVRSFYAANPTRFDPRIRIPQIPGDEMEILTRGLDDNRELILPGSKAAAAATAVQIPVQGLSKPDLKSVPTVEEKPAGRVSEDLMVQMVEWAVQQERPVRRSEFIAEFARGLEGSRAMASKTDVDAALAELKTEGRMEAVGGLYTVKEVAA